MGYTVNGTANLLGSLMTPRDLEKAALYGEPSYIWRAGQERRLSMIRLAAGDRLLGRVLENGCGVGMYLQHLAPYTGSLVGLEYDLPRARKAHARSPIITNAACEQLPFPGGYFDFILSHEVLEHVRDDRRSVEEMVRVLRPHGLIAVFLPNLGYPYETHGVFWKGQYHFGNIPLVHYLPASWRQKLAPHVRAYSTSDLRRLFAGLPVNIIQRSIIFGAYDNIISHSPTLGSLLRAALQWLERTPLKVFGLSHFWVIEKT
jgi:SAM-dependent methyltransferase